MRAESISFEKVNQFSTRDKAYQKGVEDLSEFFKFEFNEKELLNVVESRKQFPVNRNVLVEELNSQYRETPYFESLSHSISLLKDENTFTVITAHQPSLLMGPLYYIYKICSAINVARRRNTKGFNILPIFILGAEDHDFDEIDHLYLFNKEIKWLRDQEGATGRMTTQGIDEIIQQTSEILGNGKFSEEINKKMAYAQRNSSTYGEFMFHFINQFFSEHGLIVVNFDNKAFKNEFIPFIKKEIFESVSKPLVENTQKQLENKGYGQQAFVRDINFFYLSDKKRNRIEKNGDRFEILDTSISFSKEELISEIDNHPSRFSPNVIMRPIFQELIMPNLAYIGGGGELAYWMERKKQFEKFNIFYPMLIRRKSAAWLSPRVIKTINQINLSFEDLLLETDVLIKKFAIENSDESIEIIEELNTIEKAYNAIKAKASVIDSTLSPKLDAMKTNHFKAIEKIQTRMVRSLKQKNEVQINKIKKVKDQLFPGNGLQERKANFMEFYINHGQQMIKFLINECDPFQKEMLIIYDEY